MEGVENEQFSCGSLDPVDPAERLPAVFGCGYSGYTVGSTTAQCRFPATGVSASLVPLFSVSVSQLWAELIFVLLSLVFVLLSLVFVLLPSHCFTLPGLCFTPWSLIYSLVFVQLSLFLLLLSLLLVLLSLACVLLPGLLFFLFFFFSFFLSLVFVLLSLVVVLLPGLCFTLWCLFYSTFQCYFHGAAFDCCVHSNRSRQDHNTNPSFWITLEKYIVTTAVLHSQQSMKTPTDRHRNKIRQN